MLERLVEMKARIRSSMLLDEKKSYADGNIHIPEGLVDCSAGYNPYGAPEKAFAALKNINFREVYEYPHGEMLQQAVCDYWSPYVQLSSSNILLCDGSIGGIYLLNAAFAIKDAAVLALAPHFSDYSTHAGFLNIAYRPVYLRNEAEYKVDIGAVLDHMDENLSLVYIDNPNNPTGQALSLEDLRAVLGKAAQWGIYVIADEAYGDYMDDDQSAMNLLQEYENLMVLRTFSKGWGLAGLRVGYLAANAELLKILNKISNPYTASQPARIAAIAALQERAFLKVCKERIAVGKTKLRQALGETLKMAYTLDTCPICLISHIDSAVDLSKKFLEAGILAYSGASFDGLGINSIRLRLPAESEWDTLFEAVRMMG